MNEAAHEKTPFRIGDFFDLRSYYWQTRQWHYLKQGLPAVIVSGVILLPILFSRLGTADGAERYRIAFNRAVRNQDHDTAYLFRKKMEALQGTEVQDREFRFNCAMADIGRGQAGQGLEIIRELAPSDAFGYGPAHLWLARKQIGEDPSMAGESSKQTVHHLQGALRDDPNNQSVHLALGHHYFRIKAHTKAIKHLTAAVESNPQLHLVLATLHNSRGEEELSQEQYQLAAESLKTTVEENPNDLEARVNLSAAYTQLGDFNQAVRSLVEGIDNANEETRAKIMPVLSALYLSESDRLRTEARQPDDPKFAASLMLLSKALEFAPNNEDAINRIAEIATQEGETAEKAVETLKKLIAAGKMTPLAHLILGTSSLEKGDPEKAKLHFNQAYRLDPQMPSLLNNVAWMLAHQESPDLPKALAVVNQAIEATSADDPIYSAVIDTRGRIYVKMKRWQEALVDLELALKSLPPNEGLHRALAVTYRELGDDELASEHERLADGIR